MGRTLAVLLALAVAGCDSVGSAATASDTVSRAEHRGAFDAGFDDAGVLIPDAGAELDAGGDAGSDAGVRDAGTDGGPLPSCIGEGVWRNDLRWCENLANVVADYDCDLIFREGSGICTWSGTTAEVRSLTFVLEYRATTHFDLHVYACHRPAPTDAYRQTCEVPLRRECEVAETDPDHRDGVDYVPLCAAAADRGVATRILHHSPHTGCPDS